MEKSMVNECVGTIVLAMTTLDDAKQDYKAVVEGAFETYGVASKTEQRNLLKIAKAKFAGKVDEFRQEIDNASDLLVVTTGA